MSDVSIRADHGGLYVEATVSTRGTADDYLLCLDAALRAVAAALAIPTDAAGLYDQDDVKTQPFDPTVDYEASPTERARAQRP